MKVGIALGAGSARGLAHVPMLEALDEMGVRPSVIVGCSMGALMGALYAGGMSGAEIRERVYEKFASRTAFMRHVFSKRHKKLSEFLALQRLNSIQIDGVTLAELALPKAHPVLMEDHPIPLRIVATNFETMEEVVLDKGPVLEAIGASIAIPGIISGPRINGHIHVDGGMKNPVPFNHVQADIVVALDVTGRPKRVNGKVPSNFELGMGSMLIMFNELAALRRAQHPPDIYVSAELGDFGLGDFFRAREMMDAAMPAKEQFKRELEAKLKAAGA